MTDSPIDAPPTPDPAASSSVPVVQHARRRSSWPWLVLLLAIAAGALWFWDAQKRLAVAERSSSEWQQIADELRGRQLEVDRELEVLRDRQRTIDSRLTDTASGQRVLRNEMLGIGERAALLEEALTRLAESRQEGAQALLLDEAEFLLLMGEQRMALAGEGVINGYASTLRTFQLADSALAGLQDPLYAPLRQSLAQEIAAMQSAPAGFGPVARVRIEALLADLPTLPAPSAREESTDGGQSRLAVLLGQLVTVRRLDEAGAPIDPLLRSANIAALTLQLRLALVALDRGDLQEWEAARQRALTAFTSLFDQTHSGVATHAASLRSLTPETSTSAPAIGNTLRELRNLRATRRLGERARNAPPALDTEIPASVTGVEDSLPTKGPTAVEPEAAVEVE